VRRARWRSLQPSDNKLAGRGIVVTRPRELAGGLAALVERAGGRAWIFPAIEIQDPSDPSAARRALSRLDAFDLAVFASPTAARKALEQVAAWPGRVPAFALGAGTAAALARGGVRARAPEGRADSESLLQSPELQQLAGKRVVILCGEGGRELLGETLAARGAQVERAELYRRALPSADPAELLEGWAAGEVHAVTATSSEAVANLFQLVGAGGAMRLLETPLLVAHPRVAEAARRRGVRQVLVAGPSDEEMLARLVAYFDVHD
jgi:uroporphyrinogen-III synthase